MEYIIRSNDIMNFYSDFILKGIRRTIRVVLFVIDCLNFLSDEPKNSTISTGEGLSSSGSRVILSLLLVMLVTVTDTPTRLKELISDQQKAQIRQATDGEGYYNITIFNPEGNDTIYIENGGDAVIGEALPIKETGSISFNENDLNDISLITTTSA